WIGGGEDVGCAGWDDVGTTLG
ncbi:hypothetical protein Tco_0689084, partial [Tanacetum coccineum]